MANNQNLQPPFVKGDPRINRKGRPKTFDQLRALAVKIAGEPISEQDKITRIEAMLKLMSSSRNPADKKLFLEYAYGKVKDELELNTQGVQKVVIEYREIDTAETAHSTADDKDGTEKV